MEFWIFLFKTQIVLMFWYWIIDLLSKFFKNLNFVHKRFYQFMSDVATSQWSVLSNSDSIPPQNNEEQHIRPITTITTIQNYMEQFSWEIIGKLGTIIIVFSLIVSIIFYCSTPQIAGPILNQTDINPPKQLKQSLIDNISSIKEQNTSMPTNKSSQITPFTLEISKQNIPQIEQRKQSIDKDNNNQQFEITTYLAEHQQTSLINQGTPIQNNLPKILWILTNQDHRIQFTQQAILRGNLQHFAVLAGYQVKIVDTWTAYEFLSPQITAAITQTMKQKKARVSVFELLRLALLIQHGGVSIILHDIVLVEDLNWLGEVFRGGGQQAENFHCPRLVSPEVFFFHQAGKGIFRDWYEGYLIAARPGSNLLREVFQEMRQMIGTGQWRYQSLVNAQSMDWNLMIVGFNNFFQNLLNVKIHLQQLESKSNPSKSICSIYKLQSLNIGSDYNSNLRECKRNSADYFLQDRQQGWKNCGKDRFMIKFPNGLAGNIMKVIKQVNLNGIHQNSHFLQTVFKGPNQQYSQPINKTRNVHICVVSLRQIHIQDQQTIYKSIQRLQAQTFTHWTAVYFLKGEPRESWESRERVVVAESKGNKGLNAQVAYVKLCPKKSIIFLLDNWQSLQEKEGLQRIASQMSDRRVFGGFISLKHKNSIKLAYNYPGFTRDDYYLRRKLNQTVLNDILNHFRVFHSDLYKIIPKFDLHRLGNGQYYQDRLLYLMTIMQTGRFADTPQWAYFHLRNFSQLFDMTEHSEIIQNVTILVNSYEQYDKKQLQEVGFKLPGIPVRSIIYQFVDKKVALQNFFVFNDGEEPSTYEQRKNMEKVIPKIIHQVWIGGQIPPVKAYLAAKVRNIYPDYQYKLWRRQNITSDNFPQNYLILQRLLQFQLESPFSKMAMVADIMRHEATYLHGGFYMDFNLEVLQKNFEEWRTYKFVQSNQISFRHRGYQAMCFYATSPLYPPLFRIVAHNNTNRYDIYWERANMVTGPLNFHQVVLGAEELDRDILMIPFQLMYPAYNGVQIKPDLCLTGNEKAEGVVAVQEGQGLLGNCAQLYPYQVATEHYYFGGSWVAKKSQ